MDYNPISLNDVKYDLRKIVEPYVGNLEYARTTTRVGGQYSNAPVSNKPAKIRRMMHRYLTDLQKSKTIIDYSLTSQQRDMSLTFEISLQINKYREPKIIRIDVRTFKGPWIQA